MGVSPRFQGWSPRLREGNWDGGGGRAPGEIDEGRGRGSGRARGRKTDAGGGAPRGESQRPRNGETQRGTHRYTAEGGREGGTPQAGIRREGKNRVRRGGDTGREDVKRQSQGQIQSEKLEGKSNK